MRLSTVAGQTVRAARSLDLAPPKGPLRILAAASFVNMIGSGFYLAVSMLFFTKVVGLTSARVGLGLAVAAIAGIAAGVPIGHLADRLGPQRMYVILLVAQGGFMLCFPPARGFGPFLALICFTAIAQRGAAAANGALVAQVSHDGDRTRALAFLRSVINLGVVVGTGLSAWALQADSVTGYTALIVADGLTFFAAAAIVSRLPANRSGAAPQLSPTRALRDRPYLALAVVVGALGFQYDIVAIILPAWVVEHTAAPHALAAAILVLNTVLVVLFQVRAVRHVVDVASAARAARRSGALFLLSCTAFGAAAAANAVVASILLLAGIAVHTAGELRYAVASFELGYGLADPDGQGQYQGAYNLVTGIVRAPASAILSLLCLDAGTGGWLALGAGLLAVSLLVPPVSARAQRTRHRQALATAPCPSP